MDQFRHLSLTFPRDLPRIALGCAGGTKVRYEVRHIARGQWELTIDADDLRRTRTFTTQRDADAFARRDFARRQLLRAA